MNVKTTNEDDEQAKKIIENFNAMQKEKNEVQKILEEKGVSPSSETRAIPVELNPKNKIEN